VALLTPRYCVEIHSDPEYICGTRWYSMRRYDDHLRYDSYGRTYWRTVGVQVLQFLEDFHHKLGLVHGDIKKSNILVNKATNSFVVADYEFAQRPIPDSACSLNDDYMWYYISLGMEFEKPYMSWRSDLVALGYLLASLTTDLSGWTFEKECWERRGGHSKLPLTDDELIALRTTELAKADPAVLRYLARVWTIPWYSPDPPPRSFYEELASLFNQTE